MIGYTVIPKKKEMDVYYKKDVHFFFRLGIETYFADSPS